LTLNRSLLTLNKSVGQLILTNVDSLPLERKAVKRDLLERKAVKRDLLQKRPT